MKSRHSKSGERRILHPPSRRSKPRADALYVVTNALVNANRTRIITLALSARLPTIFNTRDFVQAGGLMSYGPNYPAQFRHTAEYVDKILRGTKPGDLPVEQPTKFDLVINLTTAKALGLEVPPRLPRERRRGDRIDTGMSAIGTKRTWPIALHMSAFDPKRTFGVGPSHTSLSSYDGLF